MRIGEIAERSGVSARMLRHYESLGLVVPSARAVNGYRQYSEDDVQRLFRVEGLRALGLGLREIADVLGDPSFEPTEMVEQLIVRTRDRLAQEEALLRRLEQVRSSAPEDWSDVLRVIALMRGLAAEDPSDRQRLALSGGAADERSIGLVVEAALAEEDPNAAGALDWALARAGDAAVPLLADALDESQTARARRAAEALSKIDTPLAREVLAAAIDHPDPQVRGRAALRRGAQGGPGAIPALVDLVVEGDCDVQAADALAELASSYGFMNEVVDAIEAALASADAAARRRLVQALGDMTGEQADALVKRLTGDADRRVAATAAYLLRRRRAPQAVRRRHAGRDAFEERS